MLSKESYKLLKNFPEKVYIKDKQPIHHELFKAGYLAVGWDKDGHNYYHITDVGHAAVEDHEYAKTSRGIAWAGVILGGLSLLKDLIECFCG